ncbi:MAG: SURF1 family protein [Actinophytocola sp.]|uniref:SURF1 family cytochrome oxidase biogenesis protein n=1 Tax=Actinophytocola sp. TaxID=1872138 RepID=UPI0013250C78|nr:SURF1 family protein [Actinophytocola sp.]MPZ85647.1 SURF1 family protein [Actinophytocola sp.]
MRLRFLLRPGWLALTLAVLAFAVACFAVLAPWQFGRHAERKATNDAISRSFSADPVPVERVLPSGARPTADTEWRTVTLTGAYLADDEVVARLRTVQGQPAFEVLTPFRLEDGAVVLVDRGYLRPEESAVPDYPAPPSGRHELTARIRADERDPRARAALPGEDGHQQVYAVDSRAVAKVTGLAIRPGYVQLTDGSPGVLAPLPLPELDAGPFLSYALQWITFGTMALLAWLYFSWREIRPGGALTTPRPAAERPRRVSVARQIAEEEARERAASPPPRV